MPRRADFAQQVIRRGTVIEKHIRDNLVFITEVQIVKRRTTTLGYGYFCETRKLDQPWKVVIEFRPQVNGVPWSVAAQWWNEMVSSAELELKLTSGLFVIKKYER